MSFNNEKWVIMVLNDADGLLRGTNCLLHGYRPLQYYV